MFDQRDGEGAQLRVARGEEDPVTTGLFPISRHRDHVEQRD